MRRVDSGKETAQKSFGTGAWEPGESLSRWHIVQVAELQLFPSSSLSLRVGEGPGVEASGDAQLSERAPGALTEELKFPPGRGCRSPETEPPVPEVPELLPAVPSLICHY